MQMVDIAGAQIEKHLGVLVFYTPIDSMVDRFKEKERNQVSGLEVDIAVDDRVPHSYPEIIKGLEGIHIGGDVFFAVTLPEITVCRVIRPETIGNHTHQPSVVVVELHPVEGFELQLNHGKRGASA